MTVVLQGGPLDGQERDIRFSGGDILIKHIDPADPSEQWFLIYRLYGVREDAVVAVYKGQKRVKDW